MLTLAVAWIIVSGKSENGLHLVVAMGCDVAIVYWIAQAIIALRP